MSILHIYKRRRLSQILVIYSLNFIHVILKRGMNITLLSSFVLVISLLLLFLSFKFLFPSDSCLMLLIFKILLKFKILKVLLRLFVSLPLFKLSLRKNRGRIFLRHQSPLKVLRLIRIQAVHILSVHIASSIFLSILIAHYLILFHVHLTFVKLIWDIFVF